MSESCSPVSPVRIAVIQYDPQVGLEHCESNVSRGLALARRAAREGANLIVLPELANTGYTFNSRAEAYSHAQVLQDGPCLKTWADFARQYQVYLAAGFAERDGLKLYDSAVLFGPEGLLGHYRKAHLWNQEKLWFTPGDLGFPVFDTPIGRIGLLICWDIWFPEVPRVMAAQGADIICSLNNWVWTPPPLFDDAGLANGWPIGEVGSAEAEEIIYADVDLSSARSAPIWNSLNDLPRDRRTDLYDATLGYRLHAPMPR